MITIRKVKRFQGGGGYPPVDVSINKWVEETKSLIVDIELQLSTPSDTSRSFGYEVALVTYEENQ